KLWDTTGGQLKATVRAGSHPAIALAFSPDGRTLATRSKDAGVRLWDTATGQLNIRLQGSPGDFGALAFSPDGRWVATSSGDQRTRLWDAATGAPAPLASLDQLRGFPPEI